MILTIQYFAIFKDQAKKAQEDLDIDSPGFHAQDAREVYEYLKSKYQFHLMQTSIRVAINDAFADWDTPLNDGDKLTFIPPVSGG